MLANEKKEKINLISRVSLVYSRWPALVSGADDCFTTRGGVDAERAPNSSPGTLFFVCAYSLCQKS